VVRAVYGGFVDQVLLPSPRAAFDALWSGLQGKLGWDLVRTVQRTVWAILIAAVIGIPLGIVLGSSVRLYRALEFVIDFFRSPRPLRCSRCSWCCSGWVTRPRSRWRRSGPSW
jgi:ABC-type nitrate/sulfonate/bicarbonate transport system permease component